MNDLQLAWSERQKQYIKDLESDINNLNLGSKGYLQNERIDSIEFDIEIKNPRVHWWQFWNGGKMVTVQLKNKISIDGIISNLRKERDKAQEIYNKVQTKDFTESNCEYFNGFEESGYRAGKCKYCNYDCERRFQPKNEEEILERPYVY